jgi:hypothetical protein
MRVVKAPIRNIVDRAEHKIQSLRGEPLFEKPFTPLVIVRLQTDENLGRVIIRERPDHLLILSKLYRGHPMLGIIAVRVWNMVGETDLGQSFGRGSLLVKGRLPLGVLA